MAGALGESHHLGQGFEVHRELLEGQIPVQVSLRGLQPVPHSGKVLAGQAREETLRQGQAQCVLPAWAAEKRGGAIFAAV